MRILSNRTHVTLLHTLASLLAAPSVLFSTRIPEAASAISQTIEVMRLSVTEGARVPLLLAWPPAPTGT